MHGVKRQYQSPEAINARKQKEQSKIKEYLALSNDILARKKNKDWSTEALELTTRMLQINPEFYSVWNYRRNIMLNGIFPNGSPEQINTILSDDLSMTAVALKAHPKVYWIWNHRRWCLEMVPAGPGSAESDESQGWRNINWNKELLVVEKMLDLDARNFQAWNYRRYVLANMPVPKPASSELAYTTRKIEASFSNFSAWHQRSKVLALLWETGKLDPVKSKEREYDLARNAMYTDPSDQSVWIYHRWLVGTGNDTTILEREILAIQELLDEQPDSKWCMDSLVHYKRLLLTITEDKSKRDTLKKECIELLHNLRGVDSDRRRRYEDIATSIAG